MQGCARAFLRNGHLQRHILIAHSNGLRPHACTFEGCLKSFSLLHHLRRHEKLHEEPCPYACDQDGCGAKFSKKYELKRHKTVAHGVSVKEGAGGHFGSGLKTYVCGVDGCAMPFAKWTLVVAHRRETHRTAAPMRCGACEKSFGSARNLHAHIQRVHVKTGREDLCKHPCPYRVECPDRHFSSRSALKVHVATVHEGRRPYRCEQCEKTFGHKHLLARHRRTHDAKPPPAPAKETLGKGTGRGRPAVGTTLLERLTGTAGRGERPHECPVPSCRQRFHRAYDLDRHCACRHAGAFDGEAECKN